MAKAHLPLNQILKGDCVSRLAALPEKSVDLIFADPPYNLQLQNELWRPNMTKVDAVTDTWDQFSSLAEYDDFTRAWLTACRRVLKDTGTLWVIGSYHNIYRVGSTLMDLGFWILNDVTWIKCLSGNTELFALINGKPIVTTVKDLIRIDLAKNSIELPSYDAAGKLDWVNLTGWQRVEKSRGVRIQLEDGSWVECTPNHCFPLLVGGEIQMVPARDIRPGQALLQLKRFELPDAIPSDGIDQALGEFIGWYLAEGSLLPNNKGLQLAMAKDELPLAQGLIDVIQRKFGVVGRTHIYRNSLHLVFPGRFIIELVNRFIRGNGSKSKRLAREALFYGPQFLQGVLTGYLRGDGHWDEKNQRWRLGFTTNYGLLTDIGIMGRLLGHRLHSANGRVPYQRKQVEIIRGELRENEKDQWSYISLEELGLPPRRFFVNRQRYSLAYMREKYKLITRKNPTGEMKLAANHILAGDLCPIRVRAIEETTLRTFYDLSVDGNHVFALANGLLTHNSNPMPNFRGVRFTNAHETLLWAQKQKGARYTFNYHAMKSLNDDLQMRSDWHIPICSGKERIKVNGFKAHSTQKPEALLYRVLLSSSNPGDVVLDPFFGTGTTGAVARKLGRCWIGIERDERYIRVARKRIDAIQVDSNSEAFSFENRRLLPRIPFGILLERGLLKPGQKLYFGLNGKVAATILANGQLKWGRVTGSIHAVARAIHNSPCNGWDHWYYLDDANGERVVIDRLRDKIRAELKPVGD